MAQTIQYIESILKRKINRIGSNLKNVYTVHMCFNKINIIN